MSKIIIQQVRDHLAKVEKLLLVMDREYALGELAMIEDWARKKYMEMRKIR